MPTLNLSLPDQLKTWIARQIETGRYSSASDYLRDLIREDIRRRQEGLQWLSVHLKPLAETPSEQFISAGPKEIKIKARRKIKE